LSARELVIERVFVHEGNQRAEALAAIAEAAGLSVIPVDDRTMRSIAQTRSPQGIVAVARYFHRGIEQLAGAVGANADACLVAVLHEIADPGNAGTLIRSADALGARAICCGSDGVDPYNDKVVRASMGSMFHLPLFCYDEWPQFAAAAAKAELAIVAAEAGAPDVRAVTLPKRAAVVVGHERKGLSGVPAADISMRVGIPQSARAESLNAAVAGSIIIYEIARAAGCLPTVTKRTNDA
jgi:TrmH family RNA methyltransferase